MLIRNRGLMMNRSHSEATKKKIGDANRGKRRSQETRRKLREAARRRYGNPKERFWSHVDTSGGQDSCWAWLQSVDRNGYGYTWWDGQTLRGHRVAWLLTFGDIPIGACVLHKCDNPSCCNPMHLWIGTRGDNVADKVAKRRQATGISLNHPSRKGEMHPRTKLSERDVLEIRNLAGTGVPIAELANRKGLTYGNVYQIVKRQSWKHI